MKQAGGNGAGDGRGQRRGNPGAGVAQDVGHLQHAGAQTLADETADAVLLIAHDRKAHHLGAAARHGGTAGQPRQAQRCADGRTGDGKRQRHADQHRNHNAHQKRLQLGGPHDEAAHGGRHRADGRRKQRAQADAHQNCDGRGHENVDLRLLADQLADLGGNDGDQVDGQGAACAAQLIGSAAHGDQAEQHQLRRVQRVADGRGHGRARDCRRIAARRDQKRQPQLLAQRLDDRADQQAGEQSLRHRAHGVDAVAVRRDHDVLALEKRLYRLDCLFHGYTLLFPLNCKNSSTLPRKKQSV